MDIMERVKRDYWSSVIGYDAALARLEAAGMFAHQADDWLFQDDEIKREYFENGTFKN